LAACARSRTLLLLERRCGLIRLPVTRWSGEATGEGVRSGSLLALGCLGGDSGRGESQTLPGALALTCRADKRVRAAGSACVKNRSGSSIPCEAAALSRAPPVGAISRGPEPEEGLRYCHAQRLQTSTPYAGDREYEGLWVGRGWQGATSQLGGANSCRRYGSCAHTWTGSDSSPSALLRRESLDSRNGVMPVGRECKRRQMRRDRRRNRTNNS